MTVFTNISFFTRCYCFIIMLMNIHLYFIYYRINNLHILNEIVHCSFLINLDGVLLIYLAYIYI